MLNAGSGKGGAESARDELQRLFSEAGHEVTIALNHSGEELTAALQAAIASGADTIVAGGGDGTVNAVANAIIDRDVTLGVLPLGTLNHFARDLSIPLELAAAAKVVIDGHTTRVDVGEVNGRVFLNNSSVGIYPRIVQLRERYRARGAAKWIIATWATFRVTRNTRAKRLDLTVDGQRLRETTPLVFVGNNAYRMSGFDAASRESLTQGTLALYVVGVEQQHHLLRLVWRILAGTAVASGELTESLAQEAIIDRPGDSAGIPVPVAVDGEVGTLELPLRYRIRPASLSVCVPVSTTTQEIDMRLP